MADKDSKIVSSTKEQVAFDMACYINYNYGSNESYKSEKDFLTLYRKCYKATSGHNLESILNES